MKNAISILFTDALPRVRHADDGELLSLAPRVARGFGGPVGNAGLSRCIDTLEVGWLRTWIFSWVDAMKSISRSGVLPLRRNPRASSSLVVAVSKCVVKIVPAPPGSVHHCP